MNSLLRYARLSERIHGLVKHNAVSQILQVQKPEMQEAIRALRRALEVTIIGLVAAHVPALTLFRSHIYQVLTSVEDPR